MYFGECAVADAHGARLAHGVRLPTGRLAKGTLIDSSIIARLQDAHCQTVTISRLEVLDVDEDEAARQLGSALARLAGDGIEARSVGTGRVNLHAVETGLFSVEHSLLTRLNRVDESITVATLPAETSVRKGRLVATVKIIPFAVQASCLQAALALVETQARSEVPGGATIHPMRVDAFMACRAHLVQTRTVGMPLHLLEKSHDATRARLARCQAELLGESRCDHEIDSLVAILASLQTAGLDWILVLGASATGDRRDVIPAAIERSGGTLARFGLPMDPGNLMLLGTLGHVRVIGLPGCARSPRDNGVDWVLARLAAGLVVDDDWCASLGVGGLLKEHGERRAPRAAPEAPASDRKPGLQATALVLAAGRSKRFGVENKLLSTWREKSLLDHVLDALARSECSTTLVVTGCDNERVEAGLRKRRPPVSWLHHAGFESGMAGSLACGIAALLDRDAVLVCLADMPTISPDTISALMQAATAVPDALFVVPVHAGRRGNPVLIRQALFDDVLALQGDVGARAIAERWPDCVLEVPVDDEGVLLDVDIPADTRQLR